MIRAKRSEWPTICRRFRQKTTADVASSTIRTRAPAHCPKRQLDLPKSAGESITAMPTPVVLRL
jgi:hypothetical protein